MSGCDQTSDSDFDQASDGDNDDVSDEAKVHAMSKFQVVTLLSAL